MSLKALTPSEKAAIKGTLQKLNAKYGSGGDITSVDFARRVVRIKGGKTSERIFTMGPGQRVKTIRIVFAGQQSMVKEQ